VPFDQLVFPDEIHDFLLHRTWLAAYHAASDFFDRISRLPEIENPFVSGDRTWRSLRKLAER